VEDETLDELEEYRDRARDIVEDLGDDWHVDEEAEVRVVADGVWVACWRWFPKEAG